MGIHETHQGGLVEAGVVCWNLVAHPLDGADATAHLLQLAVREVAPVQQLTGVARGQSG